MKRSDDTRRSDCPISYGLDVFGDKWTLLVLRDLLLKGKRHFREFQASDENIATNILTDRLKRLEVQGIIMRVADPDDGRQVIYRPTAKGLSLVSVLYEIAAWGARHDAKTGAPDTFLKEFDSNRQALIDACIDDLKKTSSGEG